MTVISCFPDADARRRLEGALKSLAQAQQSYESKSTQAKALESSYDKCKSQLASLRSDLDAKRKQEAKLESQASAARDKVLGLKSEAGASSAHQGGIASLLLQVKPTSLPLSCHVANPSSSPVMSCHLRPWLGRRSQESWGG